MKKSMILLAVTGVVLACTGAANSQTFVLTDSFGDLRTAERGIHKNALGYVIFENGGSDITVQLWKAAHSYTYVVQSNHIVLGTFTTDKKGHGELKVHVDVSKLGPAICIWTSTSVPRVNLLYVYNPFWIS